MLLFYKLWLGSSNNSHYNLFLDHINFVMHKGKFVSHSVKVEVFCLPAMCKI